MAFVLVFLVIAFLAFRYGKNMSILWFNNPTLKQMKSQELRTKLQAEALIVATSMLRAAILMLVCTFLQLGLTMFSGIQYIERYAFMPALLISLYIFFSCGKLREIQKKIHSSLYLKHRG
jgi:choline-glycine betaine transporter